MELWIDLRRVDREGTDRPDRADASLYFGHRRFLPDQVSRHARTTIRGAVISNVRRIGWTGRACGLRCFRRRVVNPSLEHPDTLASAGDQACQVARKSVV